MQIRVLLAAEQMQTVKLYARISAVLMNIPKNAAVMVRKLPQMVQLPLMEKRRRWLPLMQGLVKPLLLLVLVCKRFKVFAFSAPAVWGADFLCHGGG